MSRHTTFGMLLWALLSLGCGSQRQAPESGLYGPEWELEYLSGPRIAFDGLFPDKKPVLAFEQATGMVDGNSGCNGYSAPFELRGPSIRFGEPGPSTLMYCGEGENFFRSGLQKIDGWNIDSEGRLNLLVGEVPMMRFHRMAAPGNGQ